MVSHQRLARKHGERTKANLPEPPIATTTAMDRVISTPELLEMILLRLDMRTLLVSAQRTCVDWRDMIVRSPSIQQALFLQPLPPTSFASFQALAANEVCDARKSIDRSGDNAIQNPLLAEFFNPWFQPHSKNDELSAETLPMAQHDDKKAAFLRRGASWRRMLVQQPPAYSLGRVETVGHRSGSDCHSGSLALEDGLRMGTLYDLTWAIDSRHIVRSWKVCWSKVFPETLPPETETWPYPPLQKVLQEVAEKSEIVLMSSWVVQCCAGIRSSNEEMWEGFSCEETEHVPVKMKSQ